jgi:hypothetical protein
MSGRNQETIDRVLNLQNSIAVAWSRRLTAPTPHPALRATFPRKGGRERRHDDPLSNMQRLSEGPERRLPKGLAQGGMRMDRLRDILESGAHFESQPERGRKF